jgi:Fe-S cluster assembly iron-binding protein IscA
MVTISKEAAKSLRGQLIQKCFEVGIGFRVLVNSSKSGKATFSIKVDRQHHGDEVVNSGDVKVFLDQSSAAQLSNCQLHYRDGPDGGFFLKKTGEAKNE